MRTFMSKPVIYFGGKDMRSEEEKLIDSLILAHQDGLHGDGYRVKDCPECELDVEYAREHGYCDE